MEDKVHKIFPGEFVTMWVPRPGCPPAPIITMVQSVYRGAIVVVDHESPTGLAKITSHSVSSTSGSYWYNYPGHHSDVLKLMDKKGIQIFTDCFIDETLDKTLDNLRKEVCINGFGPY